ARRFVSRVWERGAETGPRLHEKLKSKEVAFYCTDHWKCHEEILSPEFRIQSKAETFTVEGYNSRLRHYLARFKRRGKCYGKAEHMIEKSLNLLMLKLNNELCILN
ncbi:MAG: IS1 family transposase, partial [Edaphocola sp.]